MDEAKILQLKDEIEDAQHIVFFGGAGVSTESGVPDFRSKDGLYNQRDVRFDKYRPEYLLSHSCLIYEPKVYYEFHRQKMDTRTIEPNNAHKYLAAIEKLGKLDAVVTQNIDGLHQKAGSRKVYEIHGSALRNYCMKCGKVYPEDYIFTSDEAVPHCSCGGTIRPDITLYEESLPDDAVEGAVRRNFPYRVPGCILYQLFLRKIPGDHQPGPPERQAGRKHSGHQRQDRRSVHASCRAAGNITRIIFPPEKN